MPKSTFYNRDELLNYIIQYHKIDIVDTQMQIENMKRENYLKMHNHKVWQGEANKKWYTYFDDDSKRGYSLKAYNSKKTLEDKIVEYYKAKETDPYIDQVFHEWNDQRLQYGEIAIQSYNRYDNDFKRFFPKDCSLCQKKLRQVTEEDLETFIKDSIRKFQMTAKVYSGLRTLIRGIFKYAKKRHFTDISITNFFGDLDLSKKIFKKQIKCKEEEVFTEDEVKLITTYLKKHGTIRDLGILLAFESGMRVGELSAIKKCDISLNLKVIHVRRTEITYKDPKTGKRVCEVRDLPKSEAGDRYIIVPDTAADTINAILALNPDGDYLFWENGKRIRENAFNRRLTRVCNILQIAPRSMHKIRKTYGTTLIDSDVPESLIAEQMGHKDITTTKKYYYFSNKNNQTKIEHINKAISC